MAWSTLQDARDDLRNLIQDRADDKLRHRQKCFGIVNGSNTIFKTLEKKRITDFTTPGPRLGVFLNNDVSSQTVTSDDPVIGEFTLDTAPSAGDAVKASFYIQWFTDDEIDKFLKSAGQMVICVEDVTQIAPGLQPAVLKYAAGEAYQNLASWQESLTNTYRVQDRQGNIKELPLAQHYNVMAERMFKQAKQLREDFYTRKDQAKAPLFHTIPGAVKSVTPKR